MLDLEHEIEISTDKPTIGICVNRSNRLQLLIWTREYEPDRFLLISTLVKNDVVYRSCDDAVRDYIALAPIPYWV